MLLYEVLSTQSMVDWFVNGVKDAYDRAANAASKTYDSTDNLKLARMHGGAALGKWFAENVINHRGNSVNGLLRELRAINLMPEMPGTHRQREEDNFSMSSALQTLVANLRPVFAQRGYGKQYQQIIDAQKKYADVIKRIKEQDSAEEVVAALKAPPREDPNLQAHALMNNVISQLPKEHRGPARDYVSRRGFTPQALQQYLVQNKLV